MANLVLLTGCSPGGKKTEGPRTRAEPVVLRLKWLVNVSAAGEIWALKTGIFENQGLKVEIKEGGLEHNAIKDLELGRVQFGVASADQVIRAVEKGAQIVVLAQIFQKNPLKWIYDGSRFHIQLPEDLKGLTVGITYGGNDEAIFRALMAKYGLSKENVRFYAVRQDYTPFWNGDAQLWPVYSNVEGIVLAKKMKEHGRMPMFFDADAFGIHLVANSLITSRRIYDEQPELAQRFTQAVLKGWKQALDAKNERAAADAVHEFDGSVSVELIREQLAATRELVVSGALPIGTIDKAAWRDSEDIMFRQGLIARHVDIAAILK
ncbi:MAG: ABC transporter substrate-binding protein [Dissulfuribacterales bacterium]